MAIWGVSRSDVISNGRNTAVGLGVLAGCAVAAFVVKRIAASCFAYMNEKPTKDQQSKYALYSKALGAVVGLAAVVAAYNFIPGSRFALISDNSTSIMLKLGVAQAVVGFAIDYFAGRKYKTATVVCLGGALATRFGYPVLGVLGVVGAGLGSGFISNAANKKPATEGYMGGSGYSQ